MRLNALPLYNYLLKDSTSSKSHPLLVFVNQIMPVGITALPGIVEVYTRSSEASPEAKVSATDWWRKDFWTTEISKHAKNLQSGTAIFSSSFDEIPDGAISKLRSLGVREVIFNSFGEWRVLCLSDMLGLRLHLMARSTRKKFYAISEPARLRFLSTLRKSVLKFLSQPLNDTPDTPFQNFSGNAYRVFLPQYKKIGDTAWA